MTVEQEFHHAAEEFKKLKSRPTDQELLEIYALYKQATMGDNTGSRPGMLAVKDRAKFDAWMAKKGTSKEDAMKSYVAKAQSLIKSYGIA